MDSRSPKEVLSDPDFERVAERDGQTYPSTWLVIVREKSTGLLWMGRYGISEDSSDFDVPCSWFEVEAVKRVVVDYVPKRQT
jgi:hypothetical protein